MTAPVPIQRGPEDRNFFSKRNHNFLMVCDMRIVLKKHYPSLQRKKYSMPKKIFSKFDFIVAKFINKAAAIRGLVQMDQIYTHML